MINKTLISIEANDELGVVALPDAGDRQQGAKDNQQPAKGAVDAAA